MKFLLAIPFLFVYFFSHSQPFEGQITYQNSYKSKIPSVSDKYYADMYGKSYVYSIKEGDYKIVTSNGIINWQLYISKDNKIYNKTANAETIVWIDGRQNFDSIISTEIKKNVTEILGYKCDELTIICENSIEKYYFSSKLPVDISKFTQHLYGHWYDYLKVSATIPLKTILENDQFVTTSIVTDVKEIKLSESVFQLPRNVKIEKIKMDAK